MLVLSRRFNESIIIGDDIEIRIVQIKGSGEHAQVRLGIIAPKGVTILRKEIYDEVRAENRRAAASRAARPDLEHLRGILPPAGRGKRCTDTLDRPKAGGTGDAQEQEAREGGETD